MRSSRWSGFRVGVRALAVLAIASGVVVGAATAAEAKPINSVKELKASCAKGNGKFTLGGGGTGLCDLPGGKTVICDKGGKGKKKCRAVTTIARGLVPQDTVRAPNGVKLTTQGVSDSPAFNPKVNVAALRDVVCTSLGGSFVASADGTIGACSTATTTIICNDTSPGKSCVGIADTKKHAASVSKRVKAVVPEGAGGTPSPSTTATTGGTSTTTTTSPSSTTTLSPSRR
jgi:hypothetical protein